MIKKIAMFVALTLPLFLTGCMEMGSMRQKHFLIFWNL